MKDIRSDCKDHSHGLSNKAHDTGHVKGSIFYTRESLSLYMQAPFGVFFHAWKFDEGAASFQHAEQNGSLKGCIRAARQRRFL